MRIQKTFGWNASNWSGIMGIGAALFFLSVGVVACSPSACTLMGCGPNVTILFDEPLPAGEYDVTVEADGSSGSCAVTIGDEGTLQECGGGVSLLVTAREISVYYRADALEVVVSDGDAVSQAEFSPDYTKSYPNGPDCGECLTAQETMVLDFRAE